MFCSLYVHTKEQDRFLLVRRDAGFPTKIYNRKDWRLLVIGAEPPSETARSDLLRTGYHDYRSTLG